MFVIYELSHEIIGTSSLDLNITNDQVINYRMYTTFLDPVEYGNGNVTLHNQSQTL